MLQRLPLRIIDDARGLKSLGRARHVLYRTQQALHLTEPGLLAAARQNLLDSLRRRPGDREAARFYAEAAREQ